MFGQGFLEKQNKMIMEWNVMIPSKIDYNNWAMVCIDQWKSIVPKKFIP